MRTTCERCGERLSVPACGRSPRFCSTRCRVAAHRAKKRVEVPSGLTSVRRWVRADGKRPIQVNGRAASSTKPATWAGFADVQSGPGDGFGFMLGGGVGCIDLDGCIGPSGELSALAERVLAANPGAYVELSKSGRGLHVFGLLPEGPGTTKPGFEVYSRARFIRFGTVYRQGGLTPLAV